MVLHVGSITGRNQLRLILSKGIPVHDLFTLVSDFDYYVLDVVEHGASIKPSGHLILIIEENMMVGCN
jgi:hypothetical protein